jgi:transcriptional regulator with XRE-family HTH domain
MAQAPTMTDPIPLARRLQELRRAAKMSQPELASRSGVSLSLLAKLEQGVADNPRLSTLRALARALGVSLDMLAGQPGELNQEE